MGSDIHLFVEFRHGDGPWQQAPKSFPEYGDRDFSWDSDPAGRDYMLFGFLADVRNGTGFAGISIYAPWEQPLFPHRGIPADSCYREDEGDEEDAPWLGDHSQTWVSYNELVAIDWDQQRINRGVVPASVAKALADGERPEESCGSITGPNLKTFRCVREWEESGHPEKDSHVEAFWAHNPFEECAFRDWIEGGLTDLAAQYGSANVRVLMGFDS